MQLLTIESMLFLTTFDEIYVVKIFSTKVFLNVLHIHFLVKRLNSSTRFEILSLRT